MVGWITVPLAERGHHDRLPALGAAKAAAAKTANTAITAATMAKERMTSSLSLAVTVTRFGEPQ